MPRYLESQKSGSKTKSGFHFPKFGESIFLEHLVAGENESDSAELSHGYNQRAAYTRPNCGSLSQVKDFSVGKYHWEFGNWNLPLSPEAGIQLLGHVLAFLHHSDGTASHIFPQWSMPSSPALPSYAGSSTGVCLGARGYVAREQHLAAALCFTGSYSQLLEGAKVA